MLNDDAIEELRVKYQKVGVIDWDEHQLVFRKPTRMEIRSYRGNLENPMTKPDALDQLAQATIISLDGVTEYKSACLQFTAKFLEEYPGFTGSIRVLNCLTALAGMIEDEEATELGKGVSVRNCPPKLTQKDSSNSSAA